MAHYARKGREEVRDIWKPCRHAKRGLKITWGKKKLRSKAREQERNQRRGNQLAKSGITAWPKVKNNNNVDKVIRGVGSDRSVVTTNLVVLKLAGGVFCGRLVLRVFLYKWWEPSVPWKYLLRSGERFILDQYYRGGWSGFNYCTGVHWKNCRSWFWKWDCR